jgi:beta-lactamase regulating signal transducer with metallopeptidase domain
VTVPAFWAVLFLTIWAFVALFALARLVAGILQVRKIRRGCTEVEVDQLEPVLREVLQHPGERRVRLVVSAEAQIPAAIGFRNPAIVLPAWALREMRADELRPILIHEMAHLRRRDDWTNLLQKLLRAILFFHPAVWWIDARLSLEREMACDDAVLAATGNAPAYAGSLIGLLERGCERRGWKMAQAAVARAKEATLRIARILESGSATTRVGRGALGLAAALCMTCFGVLEIAPQFVAFAPRTQGPVAQSEMPRTTDFPPQAKAAVVPAMFHPAESHQKPVAFRHKPVTPHKSVQAAAQRVIAARPVRPTTPAVVMAKLDTSSQKPSSKGTLASAVQVVMMVQTSLTDVAGPSAGEAVVNPAAVSASHAVQVQTIQVLEQDETGWHLHTYRTVTVLPVMNGEPMHSSI